MSAVIANLSMSLDGFIADPTTGVQELFGWYANGPRHRRGLCRPPIPDDRDQRRAVSRRVGERRRVPVGRRLYDHTNGWGGRPPAEAPMVVVTHRPPDDWPRDGVPISFAADGIQRAVAEARALAGDRNVAVAGAQLARECLDAGLLEEIVINLVPVVLCDGIPFLAGIRNGPVRLEDPEVTEAAGVTHLRYRVKR